MPLALVLDLARDALMMALMLASPLLAVALVVGLVVSVLQAVTSIQEQTLSFVPKLFAVGAVFLALLSWMLTIRLFPDVPEDHPAIGSIVLNMSANMLGLGNAATPMGLKAMEELQELNPQKDTATNSMVMFLAINTSSVQLILPATVVALMGAAASQIFLTTILATLFSTIAAVLAVKTLEKMKRFRIEAENHD